MGYCIYCGYDLHGHKRGEKCPECGRPAARHAAAPPPQFLLGMLALTTVLIVAAAWFVVDGLARFYLLCTAAALILPLIVLASRQTERVAFASHWGSILFCAAAGTGPLLTICLFLIVFVIGKSSNVAQLAGEGGFDYWSFWFDMWPCLLIGNPLCAAFAMMGLVLPPYHPRYVAAWALPLATMFAALAATDLTFAFAPDA